MSHTRGPALGLASGRQFHPLDPRSEDFTWDDIAQGVCRIPRYTGQLPLIGRHETYVVAQHLCLAVELAAAANEPIKVQKAVFGHDLTEGIWGFLDVCNPVKRGIQAVADVLLPIERGIDVVMVARLGLEEGAFESATVRHYDQVLYAWETQSLRGEPYVSELNVAREIWHHVPDTRIKPWSIGEAWDRFEAMLVRLGLT